MVEVNLGNIGSEDQAKRIKEKLQGKTYYNLNVEYASMAGNYPVTVWTDDEGATEEEVKDMLLFVLACEV